MLTTPKTKKTNAPLPKELDRVPSVVHAPRTDAIYNCHAYLTKVPVEAIKPFLEALTKPDEIVVDMFAGSGMTGLGCIDRSRREAERHLGARPAHRQGLPLAGLPDGRSQGSNQCHERSKERAWRPIPDAAPLRWHVCGRHPHDLVVRLRLPVVLRTARVLRAPRRAWEGQ